MISLRSLCKQGKQFFLMLHVFLCCKDVCVGARVYENVFVHAHEAVCVRVCQWVSPGQNLPCGLYCHNALLVSHCCHNLIFMLSDGDDFTACVCLCQTETKLQRQRAVSAGAQWVNLLTTTQSIFCEPPSRASELAVLVKEGSAAGSCQQDTLQAT